MNNLLDISIVVLNWNTSDLLNGALGSIVSTAGGVSFDVTVIDNASTDGGLSRVDEKFKKDPRFSFVQNGANAGWPAINRMLSEARGDYILTLDPDAILHPGALAALLAFMRSHPGAGAATAKLLNPDGSPQLYYRRIMTPAFYFYTTVFGRAVDKYLLGLRKWREYRYTDIDLVNVSEVEQPSWPCLIWRREALGPYIVDKRLPFYFLDVEMSARLYRRGYKIYMVPEAVATHLKSTSYGKRDSSWRKREYYRSLTTYFRTYHPIAALWVVPLARLDRSMRALMLRVIGREPLR